MKHERQIDEIVSRIAATLVFYRQEEGAWQSCPSLVGELRAAVAGIGALDPKAKGLRPQFFRTLEAELTARYGEPKGRQLVTMVREVSDSGSQRVSI